MSTIKKTDANPIAAALLTWLLLNLGHLIINGQTNKWLYSLIAIFIGALRFLIRASLPSCLAVKLSPCHLRSAAKT
jgi:hypothetical protein